MNEIRQLLMRLVCVILILPLASFAEESVSASPAETILKPLGIEQFSPLYQKAIDAYFTAEAAYRRHDYAAAHKILATLWIAVPPGDPAWKKLQSESVALQSVADFGTPPAYAALRMLTDCVDWQMMQKQSVLPPATVQLTVVLVGNATGLEPDTQADLDSGKGRRVMHTLNPALNGSDGEQIINESYWLFDEYILAMTQGRIQVKRVFVYLPELTVPVGLHRGGVELPRKVSEQIWSAVPASIARTTDWWHLVYPSSVPKGATFVGERFVTGGMRTGPAQSKSPCFVSDDLKFLRTANQNGRRILLDTERRVALSQWLQHEFFHYVFAAYPHLQLEVTPHQWHSRKTWPEDFIGNVEADYYEEALHKRLQLQDQKPLYIEFRHAK